MGTPVRAKNSAREEGLSRSRPRRAEVTVRAPTACTPRMVMQVCSASSTTADPPGVQFPIQPVGDLLGEPLLDLRSCRNVLDQPGELGKPEDAVARQVADMGHAGERQQMVLADRPQWNCPGQHQLVVALVVGEGGGREGRG